MQTWLNVTYNIDVNKLPFLSNYIIPESYHSLILRARKDMDDDLVLNIATDVPVAAKHTSSKKSGRWTDRLKTKRAQKRKAKGSARQTPQSTAPNAPDDDSDMNEEDSPPPAKRSRLAKQVDRGTAFAGDRLTGLSKPPTQVISSLFSYNPKVDAPEPKSAPKLSQPSNAPLTSSSGFSELGLHPLLVAHLASRMGVTKPTSIQRATLPVFTSSPSQDMTERDVFIQSQTGSGKTLSFLLPIIHDLLPLSTHSYIDRSIGTLAVVIAPTRELAKQISDVLESLLKLKLRPDSETDDVDSSTRYTRWLVSGLLSGGATRTHEKARLRKGIPILVSTPGRLLDHLQNTSSFNVGKCRWLVLDEADRLMELGFEETIKGIIQGMDGRQKLAVQAVQEGRSLEVGGWDWQRRRRTILCSATIREDVQKLAGTTLVNPIMIKAFETQKEDPPHQQANIPLTTPSESFTPPAQLSQKYVIVPLKLRLVALVALLRSILAQHQARKGSKIIVFLSCTDSVDFHWRLLGGAKMGDGESESTDSDADDEKSDGNELTSDDEHDEQDEQLSVQSPLLPDTHIYRLHGSLPTPVRLASLRGFSSTTSGKGKQPSTSSSVLLCTSVASRGLDLPLVRAVIQYDLPTEGGATEYVHRVGRTARAGKGGEAWNIVAPSESKWVKWVEEKMRGDLANQSDEDSKANVLLEGTSVESVLAKGFGGKGSGYEARATDVQLSFERWVLRKGHSELARKAFQSHMRAYSTHPTVEKHMFHVRNLHIGHLAKAFALRDAPTTISSKKGSHIKAAKPKPPKSARTTSDQKPRYLGAERTGDAERRMTEVVRAQGRMSKKGGKMISSGTGEFQIASGPSLEQLVHGHRP
ncbi:P-loop containing nucleoside triphosphate hydrolase protein [Chiua virens]|nr:P-loop containing nucleoside triphosphate hydrolase protein [Chiua virens]